MSREGVFKSECSRDGLPRHGLFKDGLFSEGGVQGGTLQLTDALVRRPLVFDQGRVL